MAAIERLSPSALSRYQTCPKMFFLADVERASRENESSPLLMQGNAVHAALDKFYGLGAEHRSRENLERALRSVWTDPAIRKPGTFSSREQEGEYGRAAIGMLDLYARDFDLDVQPLAREQWVKTKLSNGIVLFGKADRIDEGIDGGIRLVDYKTGRRRLDVEDLSRDTACRVYVLAAEDTYKRTVEKLSLIYLATGEEVSWTPEREDVDAARAELEALATEIVFADRSRRRPATNAASARSNCAALSGSKSLSTTCDQSKTCPSRAVLRAALMACANGL